MLGSSARQLVCGRQELSAPNRNIHTFGPFVQVTCMQHRRVMRTRRGAHVKVPENHVGVTNGLQGHCMPFLSAVVIPAAEKQKQSRYAAELVPRLLSVRSARSCIIQKTLVKLLSTLCRIADFFSMPRLVTLYITTYSKMSCCTGSPLAEV
jgi:hypothetical protein